MQPNLGHLKAAAQLAEMVYNADNSEHKKAAWQKAQTEYETALNAEQDRLQPADHEPNVATKWIDELHKVEKANRQLEFLNHGLEHENSFLKNQLIEKDGKIADLQKSLLSAKSATPAAAPAKPLVGAAKVAAEKKAAAATVQPAAAPAPASAPAPAVTPEPTDETKKNS